MGGAYCRWYKGLRGMLAFKLKESLQLKLVNDFTPQPVVNIFATVHPFTPRDAKAAKKKHSEFAQFAHALTIICC